MKLEIVFSVLLSVSAQSALAQTASTNATAPVGQTSKPATNKGLPGARLPLPLSRGSLNISGPASQTVAVPGNSGNLGNFSSSQLNREINQIDTLRQQGIKDGNLSGLGAAIELENSKNESFSAQQEAANALDGNPSQPQTSPEQQAQIEADYQNAIQQSQQAGGNDNTKHETGHTPGSSDGRGHGNADSGQTGTSTETSTGSSAGNGNGNGNGTSTETSGGSGSIFQDPTKGGPGGGVSQLTDRASDLIGGGAAGNAINNAVGESSANFGSKINFNENIEVRSLKSSGSGGSGFKNGSPFAPGGAFSGVTPTGGATGGSNIQSGVRLPGINRNSPFSSREPLTSAGEKIQGAVDTAGHPGSAATVLQRLPGAATGIKPGIGLPILNSKTPATGIAQGALVRTNIPSLGAGAGGIKLPSNGSLNLKFGDSINTRGSRVQTPAQRTQPVAQPLRTIAVPAKR